MERLMGFWWIPHFPPNNKKSRRNTKSTATISWSGGEVREEAKPSKRGASYRITLSQPAYVGLEPRRPHQIAGKVSTFVGWSRFRTRTLAWVNPEMHHCANADAALPILWVLVPTSTSAKSAKKHKPLTTMSVKSRCKQEHHNFHSTQSWYIKSFPKLSDAKFRPRVANLYRH